MFDKSTFMSHSNFRFNDLHNKTLLITGTTRGIGKALLPGLLEQGLNLVLVSRNMEVMQSIREELGADENRMKLYKCDLGDSAQVQSIAYEIATSAIPLDGILHNAAIDPRHHFETGDEALWQSVMQVNLFSAVSLTRRLLPQLQRSKNGRILFTGSVMFEMGGSFLTAYNATKGALQGLTYSLAHELKHTGITVNCLVPGAILVEKESATAESNARLTNWQSVGRRIVPEDMLGPLCLLLSEAGDGISGQALTIDGGLIHPLADPDGQRRRLEKDTKQ
jgi:NAD(P)-dependent dehydrogenase (short-subunit alcohol dehydrogenase family)